MVNAGNCEFVKVRGTWLPGVADVKLRPVMIGDSERAVSGTLRTSFVGVAREWTVQLVGVPGDEYLDLFALLTDPSPAPVVVMGEEVTASVFLTAGAHVPILRGRHQDPGRMNLEVSIREVYVDYPLPGFTYEYQVFTAAEPFTWDWDAAGQPDSVDALLIGGGGPGGGGPNQGFGGAGGGAGEVKAITEIFVSGNINGTVGAGGTNNSNGGNSTFGAETALGGGAGGNASSPGGNDGGSGGGSSRGGAIGEATGTGIGHDGGRGNSTHREYTTGGSTGTEQEAFGGGGGGGGADEAGTDGTYAGQHGGAGGKGGDGIDLLALGWNYRLMDSIPRFVAAGGGGGRGGTTDTWKATPGGEGGLGGGGEGGANHRAAMMDGGDAQPNTGSGGGGRGGGTTVNAAGGKGAVGLVAVRWRVTS